MTKILALLRRIVAHSCTKVLEQWQQPPHCWFTYGSSVKLFQLLFPQSAGLKECHAISNTKLSGIDTPGCYQPAGIYFKEQQHR